MNPDLRLFAYPLEPAIKKNFWEKQNLIFKSSEIQKLYSQAEEKYNELNKKLLATISILRSNAFAGINPVFYEASLLYVEQINQELGVQKKTLETLDFKRKEIMNFLASSQKKEEIYKEHEEEYLREFELEILNRTGKEMDNEWLSRSLWSRLRRA